ncbi:MAG: hypothetical protein IJF18_08540 [Oscillospiraceae bacterium]|nr:hypothetical protein [Oscillospiraceae bacterium]
MWAKLLKTVMTLVIVLGIIASGILGFSVIEEGKEIAGLVVAVIGILVVLISASSTMLILEAAENIQDMKTTLNKFCQLYERSNSGMSVSSSTPIHRSAPSSSKVFSGEIHTWKCESCGYTNHSGDSCDKCGRNKEK